MKKIHFQEIGQSKAYYVWLFAVVALLAVGTGSGLYMETHGHHVTGMNNQIVWGMPHVFAVFLIVAASGALNVASIASVFGKTMYKPLARLSALVSIGILVGGLYVLVLDLGRPTIPVVKILLNVQDLNPKSVFGWNVMLYPLFIGLVAMYLWFMLEPKMNRFSNAAGWFAFISRLVLTTGTGLIFGVLVARTSYDVALLAPMFIIMSFSFGTACYLLFLIAMCRFAHIPLGAELLRRLKNLLNVFVGAVLYFAMVFYLVKLYQANSYAYANFILFSGGNYTTVFWLGQVLLGGVLPLILLLSPGISRSRGVVAFASLLVVLGGLAQMYIVIVGGQAYPLEIFPGKEVISGFFDGVVNQYSPKPVEFLLGLSGVALALFIVSIGVKFLRIMPVTLADELTDPHFQADTKPAEINAAA